MHARLWEQPKSHTLGFGLHSTPTQSPRAAVGNSRPKSWICEPIHEEPSLLQELESQPETEYQRHHRQRKPLIRTQSAPLLISTNTTSPIYIKYVIIFLIFLTLSSTFISPTTPIIMSHSLMPRSDSFNARVRGTSHIDFKTATTGVAAKTMRNEISRLVSTVDDPSTKKVRPAIRYANRS
jgi:UTP--glucose-1-phosphate uridylyltransferase